MKHHRQIVTLAVDFNLSAVPPPENWDWAEVSATLNGAAEVKVLAAGPIQRIDLDPPPDGPAPAG